MGPTCTKLDQIRIDVVGKFHKFRKDINHIPVNV